MTRIRLFWLGCGALVACTGDDDARPVVDTDPAATSVATMQTGDDDDDDDDDDSGDDDDDDSGDDDDDDDDLTTGGTATDGPDTGETDGTETAGDVPGDWLLTIDDAASPPTVMRVDTNTGNAEEVCALPAASSFNSLALARDGTLYVHNATQSRIERVDPCDCGFQLVGPTSTGALELALDEGDGLLGLELTFDAVYEINPGTGLANAIGPLGLDFIGGTLTWSDTQPGPLALDDGTNQLYAIDLESGNATLQATLSQVVTSPGMAYRPETDTVYVCDGDDLYELDTGSGALTEIGPMGLAGPCSSLAAPIVAESCLE